MLVFRSAASPHAWSLLSEISEVFLSNGCSPMNWSLVCSGGSLRKLVLSENCHQLFYVNDQVWYLFLERPSRCLSPSAANLSCGNCLLLCSSSPVPLPFSGAWFTPSRVDTESLLLKLRVFAPFQKVFGNVDSSNTIPARYR